MAEDGVPEGDTGGGAEAPPGLRGSAAAQRLRRLAKVEALRAAGVDPYPVTYPRTHTLEEIRQAHGALAAGEETQDTVSIAARVMLKRDHGALIFLTVQDESGFLQVMCSRGEMGDEAFAAARDIDGGDWMGFEGRVVASRTGELSVLASSTRLLGKALRPLTAKARPLTDPETRARQRYLDLIVTPDSRRVADVRTTALAAIRGYMAGKGFTEVETAVLQPRGGSLLGVHGRAGASIASVVIGVMAMRLARRLAAGERTAFLIAVALRARPSCTS